MKIFQNAALLSAVLLLSSHATLAATPSGELKVVGQLLPSSCTISLGGNGTIDYGTIDRTTLNVTSDTKLSQKTLVNALTITCDNPTALSLSLSDNRDSSRGGNTATTNNAAGGFSHYPGDGNGLGFDASNHKIGGYMATLGNPKVDGVYAPWTRVENGTLSAGWALVCNYCAYAFSTDGTSYATGKVFTLDYSVAANIAPSQGLNMSEDVVLDGSTTVQVNYL